MHVPSPSDLALPKVLAERTGETVARQPSAPATSPARTIPATGLEELVPFAALGLVGLGAALRRRAGA